MTESLCSSSSCVCVWLCKKKRRVFLSIVCVVQKKQCGGESETGAYELTLLTAFKMSWFLFSNWPIMPRLPLSPMPPMPPNPNFKSFCTSDGWCKWLPTRPPTPWLPRCPLCGPWPCEFCDERSAACSCDCCWCLLWWCCCCCDDFSVSCFIFSCSSRSRRACDDGITKGRNWCHKVSYVRDDHKVAFAYSHLWHAKCARSAWWKPNDNHWTIAGTMAPTTDHNPHLCFLYLFIYLLDCAQLLF